MIKTFEHRRLWLAGAAVACLIFGCKKETALPKEKETGGVVAEHSTIDLGSIPVGTGHHFSVGINNKRQEQVRIRKVTGSCGCMGLHSAKNVCEAGECVKIQGEIHPRKVGPFRHRIKVAVSGASSEQDIVIEAIGVAQNLIEISPSELLMTPTIADKTKTSESIIKIKNNSGQVVDVFQPNGLPPGCEVKLTKTNLKPQEELKLQVQISGDYEIETKFVVQLTTSHPAESRKNIPVCIRPRERIAVAPPDIHLGVASRKQLLKEGEIRLAVTGVECDSVEFVKARVPGYISSPESYSMSRNCLDLQFRFVDHFPENDLSDSIELTLNVLRCGEKEARAINIKVPIFGILAHN